MIERPVIKEDFDGNYKLMIRQFEIELNQAKIIFDDNQENPPLAKNQPPTAGRLVWANELLKRIQEPRERFNLLDHPAVKSEEAELVFKKYEQMVELINAYKTATYANWTSKVDEDCQVNLSQPLIERNTDTNLIMVNFNPKLEAVLREVRYLNYMGEESIPESAAKLFERHDTLRLWVATLRQIVHWYNKVFLFKFSSIIFNQTCNALILTPKVLSKPEISKKYFWRKFHKKLSDQDISKDVFHCFKE